MHCVFYPGGGWVAKFYRAFVVVQLFRLAPFASSLTNVLGHTIVRD